MISLCMIVKNEADNLPQCLASVRDAVEQCIVVDTGSQDQTREIARNYDAEVYDYQWHYDFAAARNYSLEYADEPWILWLDADEEITGENITLLRQTVEQAPQQRVLFDVTIQSLQNNGMTKTLSSNLRLFTNFCGYRFSGRIHEGLIDSIDEKQDQILQAEFVITHHGYGYIGEKKRKKLQRNEEILLKALEAEPENWYLRFTLVKNYHAQQRYTHAIQEGHYLEENAADWLKARPNFQASLYNLLAKSLMES